MIWNEHNAYIYQVHGLSTNNLSTWSKAGSSLIFWNFLELVFCLLVWEFM